MPKRPTQQEYEKQVRDLIKRSKGGIPRGSPRAVLNALDASPHPTEEDVGDLINIIEEGKCIKTRLNRRKLID